jgi:hypothetical protein
MSDLGLCVQCRAYIVASDDDASVCIKCGGRNRRAEFTVPAWPLLRRIRETHAARKAKRRAP